MSLMAADFAISDCLTTLGTVASNAWTIVSGNPVLSVLFCVSLVGAGFGILKRAKKTA